MHHPRLLATLPRVRPVQVPPGAKSGRALRQSVCALVLAVSFALCATIATGAQVGVQSWGLNAVGQIGDGTMTQRLTPTPTTGLDGTKAALVAANADYSLAVYFDGTVRAWGGNQYGKLGDGTTTNRALPVTVSGLNNVRAVACGGDHSLALTYDGTVFAWGHNNLGQLGNNAIPDSAVPVQVKGVGGVGFLTDVVSIACGSQHCLAVKSDGSVYAWGGNQSAELGIGVTDTSPHRTPVAVKAVTGNGALTDVVNIASYAQFTLAVMRDSTVVAWGDNTYGQLGNNTTTRGLRPANVLTTGGTPLDSVFQVACGAAHSVAIQGANALAWGLNTSGQLGDGTTTNRKLPVAVSGLDNVNIVACGAFHTLATDANNNLYTWGKNANGQLGDGSALNSPTPLPLDSLVNVVSIGGGDAHSLALTQAPTASLSGVLTLQGLLGSATVTPLVTLEFRPTDNTDPFTVMTLTDSSGNYFVSGIPENDYNVWIKADRWLAKVVHVDLTTGDQSGVDLTLLGGDANGDNSVDNLDLGLLAVSYGMNSTDSDYDPRADFNGDDSVDNLDLGILANNYALSGDP